MDEFKQIFGIEKKDIRSSVVVLPFLNKLIIQALEIDQFQKGLPYSSTNKGDITFVHTGIGSLFVGDAVLYLKDTLCEKIFLLGACGAIHPSDMFKVGDLITPSGSLELESFSKALKQNFSNLDRYEPSDALFKVVKEAGAKPAKCLTFGSLALENDLIEELKKVDADVIDMETSAFYHAAQKIGKDAAALLYISDVLQTNPFYTPKSGEENRRIEAAIIQAARILRNIQ